MFSSSISQYILYRLSLNTLDPVAQKDTLVAFEELVYELTLDTILQSLNDEDARTFLNYIALKKDDDALIFVRGKIPEIDEHITKRVEEELLKLQT